MVGGLLVLLMVAAAACDDPEPTTAPTTAPTATATTPPTVTPTPEPSPTPTPLSVEALAEATYAAMGALETAHIEGHITMTARVTGEEEGTFEISMVGDYQAPDRTRLSVSLTFKGNDFEADYISIANETYIQVPGTDIWQVSESLDGLDLRETLRFAPEGMENVALIGEEELGGEKVYHLRGSLASDAGGLLNFVPGELVGMTPLGEVVVEVEFWIGVGDFLVRRTIQNIDIELFSDIGELNLEFDMRLSDYGDPVDIEAPDVESTLGTGPGYSEATPIPAPTATPVPAITIPPTPESTPTPTAEPMATPTPAPTRTPVTDLAKLTAPSVGTRVGWGLSGVAVAASADGRTIVVGDFGVSTERQDYGVAYVFINQEDVWPDTGPEEVTVLLPTDRDDWEEPEGKGFIDLSGAFGQTAAINGDGSVIAVGYTSGAVNLFLRPDTGWGDDPEIVTLRASDDAAFDGSHTSLAVSEDGEHIIVGYTGRVDTYGAVYVFMRPEMGWVDATETARLTTPFGTLDYAEKTSVAISKDGATIILCGISDYGFGSCFVFLKPGPEWADTTESARLLPSDREIEGYFGSSVAVSADGTTVAVGVPGTDAYAQNHGAAYVFLRPGAGWEDAIESAKLTASDGTRGAGFGISLIMTDDGSTIAVSAPGSLQSGFENASLYMFNRPPTGWTDATTAAELTNADLINQEALLHLSLERSMAWGGNFIVLGGFGSDVYVLNGALMATGTGADSGAPHQATPTPAPAVPSPEMLWSFRTDDSVWLSPAVSDGVAYVGAEELYALNASTGELLWRYGAGYTRGGSIPRVGSSPAVAEGIVYYGSLNRVVYALDAKTGKLLRGYGTRSSVESTPAVVDGVLYVGSDDDHVYAFEVSSGGSLSRYGVNEDPLWRYETGDEVHSSPAVADGTVYVGSNDGKIYALLAPTGELVWRYETGDAVYSSPAVADGTVYVGSNDGKIYALDASTGELVWRYETGDAVYSSPAVADGVVYVGSEDRHVYALDASTGELVWRYETVGGVYSSPEVVGGVVYVGSNDRHVYALDASTGELVWRYKTGSDVISSPAVANGVVYIGSVDGHVYALLSSTAE